MEYAKCCYECEHYDFGYCFETESDIYGDALEDEVSCDKFKEKIIKE